MGKNAKYAVDAAKENPVYPAFRPAIDPPLFDSSLDLTYRCFWSLSRSAAELPGPARGCNLARGTGRPVDAGRTP